MDSTIFFRTSKNKNNYIYDFNNKLFLLVHPIFNLLLDKKKNSILEKTHVDFLYYKKKYDYLKNKGWFRNYDFQKNISYLLTSNDIEKSVQEVNQLTIEVTESCNLDCLYCGYGNYYDNYFKRSNKKIDFNNVKLLIDFLFESFFSNSIRRNNKFLYISFYGGEPLLNFPLIKKTVQYVQKKNTEDLKMKFSITTNGTLLNKYINFLIDNNFELLISLDGSKDNNFYRKTKNGKESYNIIKKNIDLIKNKHPNYFKTNVNFNAVLHNKNSVDSIYSFFKDKYEKIPHISELKSSGIKDYKLFNSINNQMEKSIAGSTNKSILINDLFINIPFFKSLSLFINQYSDSKLENMFNVFNTERTYIPTGTCIPFSKKIFLTSNKLILPCEIVGQEFHLGIINNGKVEINYDNIASKLNHLFNEVRNQCNSCYFQKSCVQCIFNMKFHNNSPFCETKMDKKKFLNYLSVQLSCLENNSLLYTKVLNKISFTI